LFGKSKENNYFLFYNSFKDVSKLLPKWEYKNVHFVATSFPNKILNLLLLFKLLKLDKLVKKKVGERLDNIHYWFSPNLNFTNLSKEIKHILTIHDLSFEFLPHCFSKKMLLWHKLLNP